MKRKTFIYSFLAAFAGLKNAFLSESNLKLHLVTAILVIIAGVSLEIQRADWLWLTTTIGLVFITEYLNTAIESLTDLVSPKFDKRAGAIKDIAAGAVLLASITALVTGAIIFLPYLFPEH